MIGGIIQARMGSTRLPNKVMSKLDEKNPILFYVIKQLQNCQLIEKIVIATTNLKEDDVIEKFANSIGIDCFRGSQKDVLDRYYQCAKKFLFSTIVRIPSDKPLIDPQIVDRVIEKFKSNSFDYVTNFLPYTFPYGTEVEIISFKALEIAWNHARLPSEREHVTSYIQKHKNEFKIFNVSNSKNISHLRWCVDRTEDLQVVRLIISKINKRPILLGDILDLYKKEPKIFEINKNVSRNEGDLKSSKEDEEFIKSRK